MPLRLRVYAALAEERYGLNVYPVVVNILPLSPGDAVVTSYHLGVTVHCPLFTSGLGLEEA